MSGRPAGRVTLRRAQRWLRAELRPSGNRTRRRRRRRQIETQRNKRIGNGAERPMLKREQRRGGAPNSLARNMAMAPDWLICVLPSISSTGSCWKRNAARRSARAAHCSLATRCAIPYQNHVRSTIRNDRSDVAGARTRFDREPVLEFDAVVLEPHIGRREYQTQQLAARPQVEIMQFVRRHPRAVYTPSFIKSCCENTVQ